MNLLISLIFLTAATTHAAETSETAPPAWPRFHAKVAKDQVNLRVEPSIRARLAPVHPPKGAELSVQHSGDAHWFEILDPEECRGFFVRDDMVALGAQEKK